jgi:hypothetical protein
MSVPAFTGARPSHDRDLAAVHPLPDEFRLARGLPAIRTDAPVRWMPELDISKTPLDTAARHHPEL